MKIIDNLLYNIVTKVCVQTFLCEVAMMSAVHNNYHSCLNVFDCTPYLRSPVTSSSVSSQSPLKVFIDIFSRVESIGITIPDSRIMPLLSTLLKDQIRVSPAIVIYGTRTITCNCNKINCAPEQNGVD